MSERSASSYRRQRSDPSDSDGAEEGEAVTMNPTEKAPEKFCAYKDCHHFKSAHCDKCGSCLECESRDECPGYEEYEGEELWP